ncbi:DUF2147 domain-containing protein [Jannaschia sp. LMIT008]|uniref:DUF2147 domain-containing protein n=1 Tax=Jannaschia maritima TaxID=3032585 RepID=UPI0028115DDD|nr:DUF2147 domain-containing protein [Jannaschia sp. LMIT008]
MKTTFTTTIAALCLAAGAAFAADPVEGMWRSQPGETGSTIDVRIAQCGSKLCGTIARLNGAGDPSVVGRRIIWDMQPDGQGGYRNGKIWAPDQDKTYNSKMTLNGNMLKVEGCIAVFCRGQTWARLN